MKHNPHPNTFQRQLLAVSMTAALSLTAVGPLRAATPEPAMAPVQTAPEAKPAQKCLKDVSALQEQMHKDGYWRDGSNFGFGYPMYGYAYQGGMMGSSATGGANAAGAAAYWRARPGYEVRTLFAATQIMAQRGQQASCEALLGETRKVYSQYAAQVRNGHMPVNNVAGFRQAQLANAKPVGDQDVSYRADQLIGTEVLNPKGQELGSVDDIVLSPQSGKIAYLVIARGGLFGIDQKYVPVPWNDFEATDGAKMLVLGTTKADMAAAPHVKEHRFSDVVDDFDKQSKQVNAYWSTHLTK